MRNRTLALILASSAQAKLLKNGTQTIEQTWIQDGATVNRQRPFAVRVPEFAPSPMPIIIHLHGAGTHDWISRVDDFTSVYSHHILVHPQGHMGGWNVSNEATKAPDVQFIEEIMWRLSVFDNVDSRAIVVGYSNGAALVHRILIESESEILRGGVACASQMLRESFRNGRFVSGSARVHPTPRSVLSVHGGRDRIVVNEVSAHNGENCCESPGGLMHSVAMTAWAWAGAIGIQGGIRRFERGSDDLLYVGYSSSCSKLTSEAYIFMRNGHTCRGAEGQILGFIDRVLA
jgi:poly(3-hydroxybutyrate) depolymerase